MARNLVTRLLAAAMLVASPAIGGQVLPLLHPCPVAEDGTSHGHGGHDQHGSADQDAQCICIGSCNTTATVAAPEGVTIAFRPAAPRDAVGVPVVSQGLESGHQLPLELLPPPTAPPLA